MTAREIAELREKYEEIFTKHCRHLATTACIECTNGRLGDFVDKHFEPMLSALERLTAPVTDKESAMFEAIPSTATKGNE